MMHAILRNEPTPLGEVAAIPQELSRIIGKLLEKEPAYRYPNAAALQVDLRGLERSSESGTTPLTAGQRRRLLRPRVGRIALAVAFVGAVAGTFFGWGRLSRPEAPPSARPSRVVPLMPGPGDVDNPSFSPDGNSVVFASDRGGNWDLWYTRIGGSSAVRITETDEVENQPAWSPDGARIAFTRRGAQGASVDILVMPALGGPARKLVAQAQDPAWSPDGRQIAFAAASSGGWMHLAKVSVDGGGETQPITSVEAGFFHRRPAWTPDGETIVFNRSPGGNAGQIMRVPSNGGPATPLTRDPEGTTNLSAVVTHDGGFVIHVSDRGGAVNLWRIPIHGGVPEPITSGPGRDMNPAATMDGRRVAFVSNPVATKVISVRRSSTQPTTIAALNGSEAWGPDLSPDGRLIVVANKAPGSRWQLTIVERDTGMTRTLLQGLPDLFWARFTPDGGSLVFHSRGDEGSRIGRVAVDGTGLRWLTPAGENARYPDASSDGRLVFVRGGETAPEIVSMSLSGDGPQSVVAHDATLPAFSPDSRTLAVARGRSYAGGIGVVDAGGGEVRWLTRSGSWPTWMPGGREIAFADAGPGASQAMFTVSTDGGDPEPLTAYSSERAALAVRRRSFGRDHHHGLGGRPEDVVARRVRGLITSPSPNARRTMKPKRIAITGAAGQIGYQLVFRVASGDMLGKDQPVSLHLLEITPALEALQGVVMELRDAAFPLLHDIVPTDEAETAFDGIDYAVLVGARPRGPGMERKDLLQANAEIFSVQGKALNDKASPDGARARRRQPR